MEKSAAETPSERSTHRPDDAAYQAAIEFLFGLIDFEKLGGQGPKYRFRLARMRDLVTRLGLSDLLHQPGQPARQPPPLWTVHLAGTKGKGSTATMVAAMLSAGGLRTGLYTSPHIHHLEERFRIDVQPCSRSQLVDVIERIRPHVQAMAETPSGAPSFFELTTALALLMFRRERCDVQILEVGLGGRLDSTNVVQSNVTAITSIGLDHQNVLGTTVEAIAAEKAGIIKPGVPVVSGLRLDERPDANTAMNPPARVIEAIALKTGAPLISLGREFDFRHRDAADWGGVVEVILPENSTKNAAGSARSATIPLAVEGAHQASNAAIALMILDQLASQGLSFDRQAAHAALSDLQLIGRVERIELSDGQVAIIDTAHNEDSISALCECLRRRFKDAVPKRRVVVVFGTSRDKDAASMLHLLSETVDAVVLTRFHRNPRFQPLEKLRSLVPAEQFDCIEAAEDPCEAVELARRIAAPGGVVVVCGSFFLADETRPSLVNKASGS